MRTRALVISQWNVAQAIENAHRWLTIELTNIIGTPVVRRVLHGWVATFHDVPDDWMFPYVSLPAVAEEVNA